MFSYRHTWAQISLDAIGANIRSFQALLRPGIRLMAVVKADAYGHGAIPVARAALAAGATHLGVAFLDEALQLRLAGIGAPILILGYTPPASVIAAVEHDIAITVISSETLDALEAAVRTIGKKAKLHLKLDTGMTRLGTASAEEAWTLLRRIQANPLLELEGVFTHFADADNLDSAYTRKQFALFGEMLQTMRIHGTEKVLRHCCNTAATLLYPDMHLDMVRVGVGLYGLYPIAEARTRTRLIPAMRFCTTIAALKHVPQGQAISYGCTFQPAKDSLIAVMPVGYADGLPRQLSNRGHVLVRGVRVPIVGTVCMDQTMLDVSAIPGLLPGEEVTLFGQDPLGPPLGAAEWAVLMNSIHYEVVCGIGKRVPRVYESEGSILEGNNALLAQPPGSSFPASS
ncbi:alanine racemase [Paenibacillus filicis]|uniref:Alanine racemase n=1 Tax=Paenibacillus filicis TaxID=669464 RepID=A0ABU9DRM1_9BACL